VGVADPVQVELVGVLEALLVAVAE